MAGVDGCRHSNHISREEALEVYTMAYFAHEVHAFPALEGKFWMPALGMDSMCSIPESWLPKTPSSSSSAFWGYNDRDSTSSYESQRCGNTVAQSMALKIQLEFLSFNEDSDQIAVLVTECVSL